MIRSLTAGERAGADAATLRKASLKRALMATVVLMVLTASLWLVEDRDTAAPAEPSAPAADSATPAVPDAFAAGPVVAAPVVAEQGAPAEAVQAPGAEARPVQQPAVPEGATAAATADESPAASIGTARETEAPAVAPPASAAAAQPVEAPRLRAGPPPGPGYLIQLGVFLDTVNAESMRRELERKGYPAHLQARVVLGPYPDRRSALAAQEKIRRERKLDGMIVPPRK